MLVCLSHNAITKRGYVQKEIRYALDAADEQPESTIYLIPPKLVEKLWRVPPIPVSAYKGLNMQMLRRSLLELFDLAVDTTPPNTLPRALPDSAAD